MENISTKIDIKACSIKECLERKTSPWKLYLLTIFGVVSLILLNTVPGLKEGLFHLGTAIHSIGWPGPVMLILVNGLFIIPLGMPCFLFEMILALLIPQFVVALSLSMAAKLIGATISYIITKYIFKDTIKRMFDDVKAYHSIQHAVEKSPFKFSLILRITVMPLFLKNYGLAVPKSVTYKLYMLCVLVTTVPVTAINIYLIKQAGNITNLLKGTQSLSNTIGSITMITLSVCVFIYTARYAKRVLKEIEENKIETLQDSPKDNEETDIEADSNSASPCKREAINKLLISDPIIEDQSVAIEI